MNPFTALKTAGRWLLAAVVGLLGLLALHNRNRADRAEAEARAHKAKMADAEARAELHRRINESLAETERRHRAEQRDSDKRLAEGKRDHFTDTWKN